MKFLLVLAVLAACVDPEDTTTAEQPLCGERPLYPGHTVAFEGANVIMPRANWAAITEWQTALEQYTTCLETQ